MASTRLTTAIRESLMNSLLKRAFMKRGNDMIAVRADYARRLYEDAMGKNLAQIEALPKGWLVTDTDIKVQLGAEIKSVYFGGTLSSYGLPDNVRKCGVVTERTEYRFPYHLVNQVVKQYPGDHPLVAEFQKLDNEWSEFVGEVNRTRKVAMTAMESVSTVKKLIDVWPEVEEFAKHYLEDGERKAILPAIPRDQLNTLLNLPPEDQQ